MTSNTRTLLFLVCLLLCLTSTLAGRDRRLRFRRRGRCGRTRCHWSQICSRYRCIRPRRESLGKPCDGYATQCRGKLVCDGRIGEMKCKRRRGRGQSCNDTTKEICRHRLNCEANGGDESNKTCKRPRGPHRPCGNRWFTCHSNLQCKNFFCARTVKVGDPCNDVGLICEEGQKCDGDNGKKKCKNVLSEGVRNCEDENSICEGELLCSGNKCKNEVIRGGDCGNEDTQVCANGTKCLEEGQSKVCKEVLQIAGNNCADTANYVCEEGRDLECLVDGEASTCVKRVAINEKCNDVGIICEEGFKCDGDDGNKKCIFPPAGQKYRCGGITGGLVYSFTSETEATISGDFTGVYKFTYDGATRKIDGTTRFDNYGSCDPRVPTNSNFYGKDEWTFTEDYKSATYNQAPAKVPTGECTNVTGEEP